MEIIKAIARTASVNDWLVETRRPRILHIFDAACNLVNEQKQILSIVTPEIGNGPFNLIVEKKINFLDHIHPQSPISTSPNSLTLGNLTVEPNTARLWNPRPDWETLHTKKDDIVRQLRKLPITNYLKIGGFDTRRDDHAPLLNHQRKPIMQFSNSLVSSLITADISSAKKTASQLAGLGQGLTPSGDDFLMGALYAAWILHPRDVATVLAQGVADSAAPLTTSLSAAWLKSAARGEAGIRWHRLFEALLVGEETHVWAEVESILSVGETSGADALAGFTAVSRRSPA